MNLCTLENFHSYTCIDATGSDCVTVMEGWGYKLRHKTQSKFRAVSDPTLLFGDTIEVVFGSV